MRFASEVLTVHEQYANELRARTKTRVSTVMNCPDLRLFAQRPEFKRWDEEIIFSYHGLVAPRHGLIQAVEALGKVRSELPGAKLQIRGSGDGLDALTARVDELGLGDAVSLPTKLYPITEIVTELEKVHVGVVPSQRDPWIDDVLPTKLLEYAALGVPVITFRNPVITEYFPADTVTYVDPASPENLRDAMLELARNPEKAREQAARASVLMAGMSWDVQKQIYFDTIDRLAARRRR
jgi:glycosyltransferase involved in cell wall biosynthesis